MDFDNYDNYEMKEREQEQEQEREQEVEWEREQEQEQEQETNFDEFEDVLVRLEDARSTIVDLKNLEDQQQQVEVNMDLGGTEGRSVAERDNIPNVRKDIAGIKRSITNDVKKIFKDIFNVSIEKKNGANSESILENTRFQNAKDGRFTIEFKGKRIGWIERDRSVSLFEKKNRKLVDEFKNSMDGATREYEKTPNSLVKNLPDSAVEDILNTSVEKISEEIDQITTTLTEQELREFAGVLNPKGPTAEDRIKALETQVDYWESVRKETEKVVEEGSPNEVEKAKLELSKIESLEKTARLQADFERLKNNEKPIHDETLDIINDEVRENDLSKLERFKQWARENLIGFSAIAISIAGIITTVVIAGRKAVKETAKGVGRVAKALFNLGKKLGPLIAPILNILATAVSWGVKGLEFLSKNLWLLVIILLWVLTKLSWLSKLTKRTLK